MFDCLTSQPGFKRSLHARGCARLSRRTSRRLHADYVQLQGARGRTSAAHSHCTDERCITKRTANPERSELSGLQTGCWPATRATVAVREKSARGWRTTRAPSMGGEFSRSRRPRRDALARGSETRPYPSPNRHSARRAQRSTNVCANAPKNRRHARAFAPRGLPLRAPARARPSRRWRLTDAQTFGCCSRADFLCSATAGSRPAGLLLAVVMGNSQAIEKEKAAAIT